MVQRCMEYMLQESQEKHKLNQVILNQIIMDYM